MARGAWVPARGEPQSGCRPKPGPPSRAHTHRVSECPSRSRCWPGRQTQTGLVELILGGGGCAKLPTRWCDCLAVGVRPEGRSRGVGGGGRLSEEAERWQRHQEHSDGDGAGSLGRRCDSEAAEQLRSTSDRLLPAKVCRWSAAHPRPNKLAGE